MKLISMILMIGLSTACAPNRVDEGQRLFFGCDIDQRAFATEGVARCIEGTEFIPFDGNGRTCGTCHKPKDNFGLSLATVKSLPADDPLFVDIPGLEDPELLRNFALIDVDAPEIRQFRHSPTLVDLQAKCNKNGECISLGLLGDRKTNLRPFSVEAVGNHLTKDIRRRPSMDFRVPTSDELDALDAYMRSNRVATVGGTRD